MDGETQLKRSHAQICNICTALLIYLLSEAVAWHNSRYNHASAAEPQLNCVGCSMRSNSGRKVKLTLEPDLSEKIDPQINRRMNALAY